MKTVRLLAGSECRHGLIISIILFSVILLIPRFSFADDGQKDEMMQKMIKRVDELERKVETLNNKLKTYEKAPTVTVSEEMIQRKVDEALSQKGKEESALTKVIEGGLVKALKDVNLSGFVDTSYVYNFGGPNSRTNTARVFDTEANNFSLQAAELVFEKLPPDTGGVGFRTDLYFGEDAEVITPTGSNRDQFDLQQAYVSFKPPLNFNLPIGKWQWIKFGKFVTMHGAEVIEAKDNWNFSRSLLFGYAIPFTHTGVRIGYDLFDGLSGYVGANNGWDTVKDNNNSKSFEGSLFWAPIDKFSLGFNSMHGPEQTNNDHSWRSLYDVVAQYKPFDKCSLMLNYDFAADQDAASENDNTIWQGVAGYIKYDLYSWLSLVNRFEWFQDRQGVRVVAGTRQKLWENTFTIDVRPYKDLITRLEYRHDKSDENTFTRGTKAVKSQDTFAVELIYPF